MKMKPLDNITCYYKWHYVKHNPKARESGACPQGNFQKLGTEVCGNFDHINPITDRLSSTLNITACCWLFCSILSLSTLNIHMTGGIQVIQVMA